MVLIQNKKFIQTDKWVTKFIRRNFGGRYEHFLVYIDIQKNKECIFPNGTEDPLHQGPFYILRGG